MLEETNVIDIIVRPVEGKVLLVIVDGGDTKNPEERFEKFVAKLRTYVNFVIGEEFKKEHPGVKPNDVTIKVEYYVEPTEAMKQIVKVTPRGDPQNAIAVKFEKA